MAGRPPFALVALMSLAACGGSVDGPGSTGTTEGTGTTTGPVAEPPLQPVQLSILRAVPGWTITDSGAPDTIVVTRVIDGAESSLTERVLNVVAPGFEVYVGGSTINAVRGVTPSGEGTAFALHAFSPDRGADAVAERLSETTVPTSGSASFEGAHMGLWVNAPPTQLDAHILGEVFLSADFDAQRIDGVISNRRNTGSARFSDLELEQADIVDGAFRGVAAGGALEGAERTLTGAYSGLLVGLNSPEVVGTVIINHFRSTPPRAELGAFVARDPTAPPLP